MSSPTSSQENENHVSLKYVKKLKTVFAFFPNQDNRNQSKVVGNGEVKNKQAQDGESCRRLGRCSATDYRTTVQHNFTLM